MIVALLCVFSLPAFSQEQSAARELLGQLGGRAALINLYTTNLPDGSARVTGEYIVLPLRWRHTLLY